MEINAVLIMQTLFGFELGNYYRSVPSLSLVFPCSASHCMLGVSKWTVADLDRDVLVLFAFIAGHGILLVLTVVFFLRERR